MKVGNSASAGMGCARALLPVKISSAIDLRYPAALAGVCRLIIGLTRPRTVYAVRCDGPTAGRAIGLRKRQTVVTPVTNGSPVPTPPVGLRRFVLPLWGQLICFCRQVSSKRMQSTCASGWPGTSVCLFLRARICLFARHLNSKSSRAAKRLAKRLILAL